MGVSENEKLELNIAATIQFSFGSICDKVQTVLQSNEKLAKEIVEKMLEEEHYSVEAMKEKVRVILDEKALNNIRILQREVRNQGNNSIRVIENHMQHFKVLRRHKYDKTNVDRIAKRHQGGDKNGDSTV